MRPFFCGHEDCIALHMSWGDARWIWNWYFAYQPVKNRYMAPYSKTHPSWEVSQVAVFTLHAIQVALSIALTDWLSLCYKTPVLICHDGPLFICHKMVFINRFHCVLNVAAKVGVSLHSDAQKWSEVLSMQEGFCCWKYQLEWIYRLWGTCLMQHRVPI